MMHSHSAVDIMSSKVHDTDDFGKLLVWFRKSVYTYYYLSNKFLMIVQPKHNFKCTNILCFIVCEIPYFLALVNDYCYSRTPFT